MRLRHVLGGTGVAIAMTGVLGGTAFADHCTNAERNEHDPNKGVQVVLNTTDDSISWANQGVLNRIDQGIIDPASGEGFHGNLGLDFDGDGSADAVTYFGGPEGDALPETAIQNGSPDHGIVQLGP